MSATWIHPRYKINLTAILTFSVWWIFLIEPGTSVFISWHRTWPDLSHSWKPSIPLSVGPGVIFNAPNQAMISVWKKIFSSVSVLTLAGHFWPWPGLTLVYLIWITIFSSSLQCKLSWKSISLWSVCHFFQNLTFLVYKIFLLREWSF